jgi:hypothetical protein
VKSLLRLSSTILLTADIDRGDWRMPSLKKKNLQKKKKHAEKVGK